MNKWEVAMGFFKWTNPIWFFVGVALIVAITHFLGYNVGFFIAALIGWFVAYLLFGGVEINF